MKKLKYPRKSLSILAIMLILSLLTACGQTSPNQAPVTIGALPTLRPTSTPVPATPLPNTVFNPQNFNTTINGSGATFPEEVYKRWIEEYAKIAPQTRIQYQAKGSGGGRTDFINGVTDFGASDAPLAGTQLVDATNKKGQIIHIPTVLGAVVVAYKLDNLTAKDGSTPELNLSGPLVADIFMGKIKTWNDAAILKENANLNLPNLPIRLAVRGDSSGTTEIFARYLSVVSDEYRSKVDQKDLPKPRWKEFSQNAGAIVEGSGNGGVADEIAKTNGTLGYIDQGVAEARQIAYASIRNKAGRYINIKNNLASITSATQGVSIPDDYRIFVVNGEGTNTYPIAGLTWLILPRDLSKLPNPSPQKAKAIVSFLWWALHDGQTKLPPGYAPLSNDLISRLEVTLIARGDDFARSFVYDGRPFL